jgi:anti-sigma regulatory factor (Ser/Thr protein kinase)
MSLVLPLMGRADCIGAGLETERLARAHGWGAREAGEAKLVVVELCSNAVRYATGGTCALDLDAVGFEVRVEDRGPGFPRWVLDGSPAPGKGGLGEGLACARRLSSTLTLENSPHGGARAVARRLRQPGHERNLHA